MKCTYSSSEVASESSGDGVRRLKFSKDIMCHGQLKLNKAYLDLLLRFLTPLKQKKEVYHIII